LYIDFKNNKLVVKKGGGVLVKKTGTIEQTPQQFNNLTIKQFIYHLTDHLTGTNVDTDASGNILEAIDYYPFGSTRLDDKSGSYENNYKYTGKELDDETNLYYYGARYYDAGVGRFVSQDPVSLFISSGEKESVKKILLNPQELNLYSYVVNNPLKYIDPTGMYNVENGVVEKGDTPEIIVDSINKAFNINTNWDTIKTVSFYNERFEGKGLDDIVGQSLRIGTSLTSDITSKLNSLNVSRAAMVEMFGEGLMALFVPGGPWDIKNSNDPVLGSGQEGRKYWSYIYNGELIRYDAPGNINYGFVAKASGLSSNAIQRGARMQQFGDDLLKFKFTFRDNNGDKKYIQLGIDRYDAMSGWLKSLFNF
jgi:RHS repeat-associated protein